MDKKHFFIKLIAPRPTFSQDMTESERAIMNEHIAYWRALTEKGTCIVFGPVFDPAGAYGMGIVEVADEAGAQNIMASDPTVLSNIGFSYFVYGMRVGLVRS